MSKFIFFLFQVFLELVNCTDPDNSEKRTAELSSSITSLWDILMGLEMQLVDQLEVKGFSVFDELSYRNALN